MRLPRFRVLWDISLFFLFEKNRVSRRIETGVIY